MSNPLAKHGQVSYLQIPAIDPGRSADFYEAVFGWTIRRENDASFADNSGRLIGRFIANSRVSQNAGIVPYIYVDGIDRVASSILPHGGQIVKSPIIEGDIIVGTFHDPAGNLMGFWEFDTKLPPSSS